MVYSMPALSILTRNFEDFAYFSDLSTAMCICVSFNINTRTGWYSLTIKPALSARTSSYGMVNSASEFVLHPMLGVRSIPEVCSEEH